MRWVHRSAAAAIAAALLSTVLTVAPAAAEDQPPRRTITCGQTITESIRVANDLACTSTGHMLTITGAGVVVDLSGHTLRDTEGPMCTFANYNSSCQVNVNGGATLTNGKLQQVGVHTGGGQLSRISADGANFQLTSGSTRGRLADSRIKDSRVEFFSGIDINHNRFIDTALLTYDDLRTAVGFSVADNVIRGGSIQAFSHTPYWVMPDISGEIVRNDIRGGRILIQGSAALGELLVADNTVAGSDGDGINVSGSVRNPAFLRGEAGPVILRGNRTLRNGGHGIVFSGTVAFIDGGGNVARNNALEPQCVGLLCTRA